MTGMDEPTPTTLELRAQVAALGAAVATPMDVMAHVMAATDDQLLAELEHRGTIHPEWDVALLSAAGDVHRRYSMDSEAQAEAVCRVWQDDAIPPSRYAVERRFVSPSLFTTPETPTVSDDGPDLLGALGRAVERARADRRPA